MQCHQLTSVSSLACSGMHVTKPAFSLLGRLPVTSCWKLWAALKSGARPETSTWQPEALDGWEAYESVVQTLVSKYDFERGRQPHRLEHPNRSSLDLVPFGDLEDPPGSIAWEEDARVMSTLGLREAHAAATPIWLDGDLPVKVASLEGQALLKLIAWRDRPYERKRDAEDFCLLLRSYFDVREKLVYSRHLDVFEEGFRQSEASGRVYGREVAQLLETPELEAVVFELLQEETRDPEASGFARAMASTSCYYDLEDRFRALEGFLRGLREGRHK